MAQRPRARIAIALHGAIVASRAPTLTVISRPFRVRDVAPIDEPNDEGRGVVAKFSALVQGNAGSRADRGGFFSTRSPSAGCDPG